MINEVNDTLFEVSMEFADAAGNCWGAGPAWRAERCLTPVTRTAVQSPARAGDITLNDQGRGTEIVMRAGRTGADHQS